MPQVAPPIAVFAAMAKCLEDWGNPDATSVLCALIGACLEQCNANAGSLTELLLVAAADPDAHFAIFLLT